jgi:uncharacterized integral membrane protein
MIRKIIAALILIPLALVIVIFAVANRRPVTISLDPFGSGDPALTLPLFALAFILVIAGVIIGGAATWFGQGKWRRAARRASAEARTFKAEIEAQQQTTATVRHTLPPPAAPAVIPPPAA